VLNYIIKTFLYFVICCNYCSAEIITIGIPTQSFLIDNRTQMNIEVMLRVAKNLDIEFKFIKLPWKRLLKEVELGRIDAALDASFQQKRTTYGVYPSIDGKVDPARSMSILSYYLYQNKNSRLLWNGDKLHTQDKLFGVVRGYSIYDILVKKSVQMIEVGDQIQLLEMLYHKRIDGLINIEDNVDQLLKHSPGYAQDLIKVKPAIYRQSYYLLFSKIFARNNNQLIEKIWQEIYLIKQSTFYKNMENNYKPQ